MATIKADIDAVELLSASIGIRAIISRKVEKFTAAKLHSADGLAKEIKSLVNGMVNGEVYDCEYSRINYRSTLTDLARGWNQEQLLEMIENFPAELHDLGMALFVRSQGIIQGMLKDYPVTSYQSVSGTSQLAPSDTKMFRFMSVLEVIDHPLETVKLMSQGALLQSQVQAMRMVYPSISEAIDLCLFQSISQAKAKAKNFELPTRAEYGVKAWFGRPPADGKQIALAQVSSKNAAAKQKEQSARAKQPPSSSMDAVSQSAESTSLQRAEASAG